MLQVESGNRDFDAQGRPITSPKGAMFAAQVMPSTARNPGYGVRPAADQTPAEYNRVGQEYYQAMLNKYPGQPELARAAYNAGPGAVDAAIKKSMMQGGSPLDYLPKETQGYVQKTGGQVRMQDGKFKVDPNAQQQPPTPAAPAEPELAPGSGYSLASGQPATGIQVPGMTSVPLTQGTQLSEMQQRFQSIQDDPGSLLQYRNDTSIPEPLRRRAGERAYELLSNERQKTAAEQKFQEMIATGDNKGIANALQGRGSKGGLGDWVSLIALSYISPQMAGAKAEEMGIAPTKWTQTTVSDEKGNFKAVQVKQSASGKFLEAYNMDDTPLTAKELSRINSGADLDLAGGTYINDTTGEVGIVVRDKKNPANSYVQTDTGRKGMTGFRPQTSTGSVTDQRNKLIFEMNTKLRGKAGVEAMIIQRN
jgi:hypothetical protein